MDLPQILDLTLTLTLSMLTHGHAWIRVVTWLPIYMHSDYEAVESRVLGFLFGLQVLECGFGGPPGFLSGLPVLECGCAAPL